MTNEIKEILNDLQRVADRKCYPEDILDGSIAQEWVDYIEDYITNLQEENRQTKLLKERYQLEKEVYKSRNKKAVEYINKYEYEKYCPGPYEKDKYIMREEREGRDLLDILRGDE